MLVVGVFDAVTLMVKEPNGEYRPEHEWSRQGERTHRETCMLTRIFVHMYKHMMFILMIPVFFCNVMYRKYCLFNPLSFSLSIPLTSLPLSVRSSVRRRGHDSGRRRQLQRWIHRERPAHAAIVGAVQREPLHRQPGA